MRCVRCGKQHNGTYGQRCEDCWAIGQVAVGATIGIPGLAGLSGNYRPQKETRLSHPDYQALTLCQIAATF